ncbi:FAD-dependent monooxygenase [Nocardia nova]|uniref:FAD-dependent monooxygenase n=1 Tax=Nocardia nova TaxID=37330 RepID=UPI001895C2F1|nr:FAD-dependent monooxygenase [Nocardia nova]MBF6144036.1 FAD-dependent monooxygenase [Nocardia nova]MDN2496224.1 FAD-dependent oxidoreductase [Nocardia nova]
MSETFDVVVAGAGPVGLMLACELRLAGVEVLVVERLTEIDRTIKAGAINVPTAQAFDRRGLLPELLAHQQAAIERMKAFDVRRVAANRPPIAGHFAGIMLSFDLIDAEDPAFAGVGPAGRAVLVSQQGIEEILGARAAELGVVVRRGVEVTDLTDHGDGVTVRCRAAQGGGAGSCGGEEIRASWLVGCDGGRSTVRKLAGFDFPGIGPEITGRQAVVEMSETEGLQSGWHDTEHGIYVYGPTPGRFLTVELDGPPIDRDAPITAAELEASLRRVSGVPVRVSAVHSATRFTDNTRQVPDYRKGRVLLAGDAAHVHSPFGGQGLNLGIGDAVCLGWKLAAVVDGRMDERLLDTYTAERYPIGAWVLEWTRAQVALMRLDRRSKALRAVMSELLSTGDGATTVFKRISGVLHRYHLGGDHELIGTIAPDRDLSDGTRVAEHFTNGQGVLFDFADSAQLRAAAAPWQDRIRIVTAKPLDASDGPGSRDAAGVLVRPDGYVAWAATDGTEGLATVLTRWFGR